MVLALKKFLNIKEFKILIVIMSKADIFGKLKKILIKLIFKFWENWKKVSFIVQAETSGRFPNRYYKNKNKTLLEIYYRLKK